MLERQKTKESKIQQIKNDEQIYNYRSRHYWRCNPSKRLL
jgi:hypothetical protein